MRIRAGPIDSIISVCLILCYNAATCGVSVILSVVWGTFFVFRMRSFPWCCVPSCAPGRETCIPGYININIRREVQLNAISNIY